MDIVVRSDRTEPPKIKPASFPKVFEGSRETFFQKVSLAGAGQRPAKNHI
jgi:hypothetical protein